MKDSTVINILLNLFVIITKGWDDMTKTKTA